MPWCPKCLDEYREGILVCADCGSKLVDELPVNQTGEETVYEEPDIDSLEMAAEQFELEYDEEKDIEEEFYSSPGVYVNNEEKAEENRSSAYSLIIIGFIGIVAITLFFFDVLPVNMNNTSKYMITGVMGALFVLFFVMGIVSLRNFKILKEKAGKENNLTTTIKEWSLCEMSKEAIDNNFDFSDTPEELKYFQRSQYIKDRINNQFMNLDEAYINRLVEEIYPDIFE